VKEREPIRWISGYCDGQLPPTPAPVGGPVPDRTKVAGVMPSRGPSTTRRIGGADGDYGCTTPVDGGKRCPQCWQVKRWPDAFGPPGHARRMCLECRARNRPGAPP
jgi:hypothetical protein